MSQSNLEEKINPFPGYTKWESRYHCGCKMFYIPKINSYFWKEWEFQPGMPFFVLFLIVSSFIVNLICTAPKIKYWNLITIPLQLIFGSLFVYCYIRTITDGPGYFPFYWSLGADAPTDEHLDLHIPFNSISPSGIISTQEQLEWARSKIKPCRCIVSNSAHRIVLRPDHLCGWTTVWIGKRNYKFFFLFNFYGLFYMLVSVISGGYYSFSSFNANFSIKTIIQVIYTVLALAFLFLTGSFAFSGFKNAYDGHTSWEEWNSIDFFNRDKQTNLEDAFGPGPCLNWFKPFSPWTNISNEEIADSYHQYYLEVKAQNDSQSQQSHQNFIDTEIEQKQTSDINGFFDDEQEKNDENTNAEA